MYEMKLHVVFCFVFIICLLLCVIYTMVVTEHIYTASSESLGSAICMGGCPETGKGVNFSSQSMFVYSRRSWYHCLHLLDVNECQ